MGKAKRRAAEIWLGMAKELYTEKRRKMKVIDKYGEMGQVDLMKPAAVKGGGMEDENDLSRAQYDLTFDVGPTSSSKRKGIVRAMTQLAAITQDPADHKVLTATAVMNLEGEGLEDIRAHYRRQLVQSGVVEPTDEEREAMDAAAQNKQPDPQAQFLLATAEKEQALAQRERANTLKTLADADKSKAQTIEVLAGIDAEEQQRAQAMQQATARPTSGETGVMNAPN
jgi:hypothetical protein